MTDELRISIPARLSGVHELARQVEEFGDLHGLPDPKVYAINLALDELITNVVMHSFGGVSDPEILIALRIKPGVLVVTVEDNGQPFDPTQDSKPDLTSSLAQRPIGGLGLYLVKSLADRLSYEFVDGRNRVTLEHNLVPASA